MATRPSSDHQTPTSGHQNHRPRRHLPTAEAEADDAGARRCHSATSAAASLPVRGSNTSTVARQPPTADNTTTGEPAVKARDLPLAIESKATIELVEELSHSFTTLLENWWDRRRRDDPETPKSIATFSSDEEQHDQTSSSSSSTTSGKSLI